MDSGKIAQIKGEGELRFAKANMTLIGYYAVILILSFVPTGVGAALGRFAFLEGSFFGSLIKISVQGLVSLFVIGPLTVGIKRGMLDLKESDDVTGCLFYAFDGSRYMNIVRGLVLYSLIGVVVAVLNCIDEFTQIRILYVPVILTSFGVALLQMFVLTFVEHIVAEDNTISPVAAFNKSIELTNGHRKDLWNFFLAYLKEILICVVTCGLGLFYFVPKFQCGLTCFYEHLKENEA